MNFHQIADLSYAGGVTKCLDDTFSLIKKACEKVELIINDWK